MKVAFAFSLEFQVYSKVRRFYYSTLTQLDFVSPKSIFRFSQLKTDPEANAFAISIFWNGKQTVDYQTKIALISKIFFQFVIFSQGSETCSSVTSSCNCHQNKNEQQELKEIARENTCIITSHSNLQ